MQARSKYGIIFFGVTEIVIGLTTLVSVIASLVFGYSRKPPTVLAFVLITAAISLVLGLGILKRNLTSCHLLLYFASVIILSKILLIAKVISLNGALETQIPHNVKTIISLIYHISLIYYFSRPLVKLEFGEKRKSLFSIKSPF